MHCPGFADGITEWEELAIDSLRTISSIDTESTALILSFPWVVDDISSSNEMSAITLMRDMMNETPRFSLGKCSVFQWVQDDMTAAEYYALGSLRDLARNNLALARQSHQRTVHGAAFSTEGRVCSGCPTLLVLLRDRYSACGGRPKSLGHYRV